MRLAHSPDLLNFAHDIITAMVNHDVEQVRFSLLGLCEPLHDVFAWAEQLRRERLPELADSPDYRWHATHTIRALAHYRLSHMMEGLGDWSLSGNHAQNGALWLTDNTYRIRILHTLNETDVPPPGTGRGRRAFYRNRPLTGMAPLFGPANDKLLILWRIASGTAVPGFRVVRTIGEWKWGSLAEADLDFTLPRTADELADLTFHPTDEGLSLELPDVDEVEDAGSIAG
jgi:hypothetical protein